MESEATGAELTDDQEVIAAGYSRTQTRNGAPQVMPRIGRAFANALVQELLAGGTRASYMLSQDTPSDHSPKEHMPGCSQTRAMCVMACSRAPRRPGLRAAGAPSDDSVFQALLAGGVCSPFEAIEEITRIAYAGGQAFASAAGGIGFRVGGALDRGGTRCLGGGRRPSPS